MELCPAGFLQKNDNDEDLKLTKRYYKTRCSGSAQSEQKRKYAVARIYKIEQQEGSNGERKIWIGFGRVIETERTEASE